MFGYGAKFEGSLPAVTTAWGACLGIGKREARRVGPSPVFTVTLGMNFSIQMCPDNLNSSLNCEQLPLPQNLKDHYQQLLLEGL